MVPDTLFGRDLETFRAPPPSPPPSPPPPSPPCGHMSKGRLAACFEKLGDIGLPPPPEHQFSWTLNDCVTLGPDVLAHLAAHLKAQQLAALGSKSKFSPDRLCALTAAAQAATNAFLPSPQ